LRQSWYIDSRDGYYGNDEDYRYRDRCDEDFDKEWDWAESRRRDEGYGQQQVHQGRGEDGLRRRSNGSRKHESRAAGNNNKEGSDGPQFRRFVTFYFTNFPTQLSNFYLRKGFEVCSKRNVYGELFGFVRYSNVCDVGKLLKAVNVVYFGNFRVKAKAARFDRADSKEVERVCEGDNVGEGVSMKDGWVGGKECYVWGRRNSECGCGKSWETDGGRGRKNCEVEGGDEGEDGSGEGEK